MSTNINSDSYAKYAGFAGIPYNCYKHLIDNEQLIWKLLKYNTPNAWEMPDLTKGEKRALIYALRGTVTSIIPDGTTMFDPAVE